MNETGNHGTRVAHYKSMAADAMNSAHEAQFASLRDGLLKLAAGWHDLAGEIELQGTRGFLPTSF
jgi:hypothetical protein